MHQTALERLVAYLREKVPMARHFDIRPGQVDDTGLVLEAPLASNFNDKKTAFAGTLASLCTLSGWAMTSLVCEEAGYQTDIAVIKSDVRYVRPCSEQMIRAHCACPHPRRPRSLLTCSRGRVRGWSPLMRTCSPWIRPRSPTLATTLQRSFKPWQGKPACSSRQVFGVRLFPGQIPDRR